VRVEGASGVIVMAIVVHELDLEQRTLIQACLLLLLLASKRPEFEFECTTRSNTNTNTQHHRWMRWFNGSMRIDASSSGSVLVS